MAKNNGETNNDIPKHDGHLKIKSFFEPAVKINPNARPLWKPMSDIGPGFVYEYYSKSFVGGMKETLKTKAKVIYMSNVMTKFGGL